MQWQWWQKWKKSIVSRKWRNPQRTRKNRVQLELLEDRLVPTAITDWSASGPGGGGALFAPSLSPSNPGTIYIASDMGEVFHTANAGQSWDEIDAQQLQGAPSSAVAF